MPEIFGNMRTIDLEAELKNSEEFNEELIRQNAPPKFYEVIDRILNQKGMKRSDLIHGLNFDRNYGYQILNGTRIPTKQHIIAIGFYLGMSFEQIQEMLKICGREVLYVRNLSDAKVIYALEHNYTYEQAVEFIWGKEYPEIH